MPRVLAVIIARAGSKGLPDKCVRLLGGRPVIDYTFDAAQSAARVDAVCLTTDSTDAKRLALSRRIVVIDRPAPLASDTATVDAAVRHAVDVYESRHAGFRADVIALLYGNVPVRPLNVIDRALEKLLAGGLDSVRSVAPLTKQHPDWSHRLVDDRLVKFRENDIYRRQDLEPLYYHDGAVVVVTREALYSPPAHPHDAHAFFGRQRGAVLVEAGATVDIDDAADLRLAEAMLSTELRPTSLRIGGRTVGPAEPVWIIAEAGVNHDGRLERAVALIDAARQAGADAVKFQAFAADRLVTRTAPPCAYQASNGAPPRSQHDMLRRLELSADAFGRLAEHARSVGIEFVLTPFGPPEVELATSLGVTAIKLASTDLLNQPLVDAAVRSGRPLIVSTGAAEEAEVDAAVAGLRRRGAGERLALLHCVSAYPTPLADANLAVIDRFRRRYHVPIGFSDHTMESMTGALAVAAGAVVLEKHLTLSRQDAGPDHFFSLEPSGFAEYVRAVRDAEAARGDGRLRLSEAQRETRRLARPVVVARRNLRAGRPLTADDLGLKRAGDGIGPDRLAEILGRRPEQDVAADTAIQWGMLTPLPP